MTVRQAWTDLEIEIAKEIKAGAAATVARMPASGHVLVVALVSAAREEGYKAGRADMREEAAREAELCVGAGPTVFGIATLIRRLK